MNRSKMSMPSRRDINTFLIIIMAFLGPSLYFNHVKNNLYENIKYDSNLLTEITRSLSQIDNLEEIAKIHELDKISATIDKIISDPWIKIKLSTRNLQNNFPDLNSDQNTISQLYETVFFLKDTLKNSKLVLSHTDAYFAFIINSVPVLLILFVLNTFFNFNLLAKKEDFKNSSEEGSLDIFEKERNLIAFELHDDISQKLAIISRTLSDYSTVNNKEFQLSSTYAKELLDTIRCYSSSLRTPENVFYDLEGSLNKLCSDFLTYSHINLKYKNMGLKALNMDLNDSKNLYRIIQESLHNAHKHSNADTVNLSIIYSHPTLSVIISDNGQGFSLMDSELKGVGLDSIKYRLKLLKSVYSFNSDIKSGTELNFVVQV